MIFLDLTVEQARLLNIALNKISGEFDLELLGHLLAGLAGTPSLTSASPDLTERRSTIFWRD